MARQPKNGGTSTPPNKSKKGAADRAAKHLRGPNATAGDQDVEKTQGVLAAIGDNGPQDVDFRTHMLTIIGYKGKVESANALLQNAYKRATEAGIDTKAIKQAIGLKKKTPDEIVSFLRQLAKSMKAAEINIPVQEEMFGKQLNRQAIIFQEGFDLGAAGKQSDDEKYNPGSRDGQIHLQGWQAGQASIISIGKTGEKVDSLGKVAGSA